VNDEFGLTLSRHRVGGQFGGFSGGIMAQLVPDVLAHDPVVETIVRHNVNSRGYHRWSSTKSNKNCQKTGDNAVTKINFSTSEKVGQI
jgi:hypothetical protein